VLRKGLGLFLSDRLGGAGVAIGPRRAWRRTTPTKISQASCSGVKAAPFRRLPGTFSSESAALFFRGDGVRREYIPHDGEQASIPRVGSAVRVELPGTSNRPRNLEEPIFLWNAMFCGARNFAWGARFGNITRSWPWREFASRNDLESMRER